MTKKIIAADSTVLLCGADDVADSRILNGFRSMIESEAVTRARTAGYAVQSGYCHTGEFGIDLIGETSACPNILPDGRYQPETAEKLLSGEISAALAVDVNGAPRRMAASCGLVNIKPTYGTVSRYGILPVVSSADTVSVTAMTAWECKELLASISGQDEKDTTTVTEAVCPLKKENTAPKLRRLGVPFALLNTVDGEVKKTFTEFLTTLNAHGVEAVEISEEKHNIFTIAHAAWNVILSAELRGNLSRYDGVRYGRRAEDCGSLTELYTKTRTEGFGTLVKSAILYGSYALSPDSDGGRFFKATEARRWVKSELDALFTELDGILLPTCSVPFYTYENMKTRQITAFNENFYTSLASLCGLPAVTVRGIQIVGRSFSDAALLSLAENVESLGR